MSFSPSDSPSAAFSFQERPVAGVPLRILVCEPLKKAGFLNAFSTRLGGVSPMPRNDLNLAYREDLSQHVDENRRRFEEALRSENRCIMTMHQTHSSSVVLVDDHLRKSVVENPRFEPDGDALVSSYVDLLLAVKTADCLPILIGDPISGSLAAVHAGWKGTSDRIAQKTVERMAEQQAVDPRHLIAALGPSICGTCYEVGEEVANSLGRTASFLSKRESHPGKYLLDLPLANREQLMNAGVLPQNIHVSGACTFLEPALFFSYRRDGANPSLKTGRLLSVIGRAASLS